MGVLSWDSIVGTGKQREGKAQSGQPAPSKNSAEHLNVSPNMGVPQYMLIFQLLLCVHEPKNLLP
jgi:hypothetical protein